MTKAVRAEARRLTKLGYHTLPLVHGTKAVALSAWTDLRIGLNELSHFFPEERDEGLGLLLGQPIQLDGRPEPIHLAAIDIDLEDSLLISRCQLALPGPAPAKRGKKGLTLIVRTEGPVPKRVLKRKDATTQRYMNAVEILGKSCQTVLPPSPHPDGMDYAWVTEPLGDPSGLPLFSSTEMDEIEAAVKSPESPLFLINDMVWLGPGEGGTVHESVLKSVASMVARGWTDEQIWLRVDRATRRAVELAGDDYHWPGWQDKVKALASSARAKSFDDKKTSSKSRIPRHRVMSNTMMDHLGGYDDLASMARAQLRRYRNGYWQEEPAQQVIHDFMHMFPDATGADAEAAYRSLLSQSRPWNFKPVRRICLTNGTYDVAADKLMPWSRDDHLMSSLGFAYEPEADCPIYEQFIKQTFWPCAEEDLDRDEIDRRRDLELAIQVFEEFVGMTLFEDLTLQKMMILKGPPATGKSTLLRLVRMLHDERAVSAVPISEFGNERYRTNMLGKLVNISSEVEVLSTVSDDVLKAITGGDAVSVRFLYQEVENVVLPTRVIVACNEMFRTRDTSGAIERRMLLLSCDNVVPEEDRNPMLDEELRAELPGIFNRMMRAVRRLYKRGYFDQPDTVRRNIRHFSEENNPTVMWYKQRTVEGLAESNNEELNGYQPSITENSLLYMDYVEWTKANGMKQLSSVNWGLKLTQAGIKAVRFRIGDRTVRGRGLTLLRSPDV